MVLPSAPLEAAVLLLCYRDELGDHILLTKRTEEVPHHKGQICFPGGVREQGDLSLWHTALREAHEEVGLENAECLGELGEIVTPTGFKVTPFVGTATPPFTFKPSADEISAIFSVPVSHLLDNRNFEYQTKIYLGQEFPDPIFTFGEHRIWGATGRILVDFLEVWKQMNK